MSVLVVGVSHQTAPVSLLERLSLDADGVEKLIVAVQRHRPRAGGDGAVDLQPHRDLHRRRPLPRQRSRRSAGRCATWPSEPTDEVVPHLYVHYDDGAISHLFHVAAGLDSMVVGEGQILGQTREALRHGQELGTVGPALNAAFQQALRVAKRTHAETDIDRVGALAGLGVARPRRGAGRRAGRSPRARRRAPARWPRSPSPP